MAEDDAMMQENLKYSFEKKDMLDITEFYADGEMAIDRVKKLTLETLQKAKYFPICPVRILLLDFQMPRKNGLEVV